MSLLDRIFGAKSDPAKTAMLPLYERIVAKARAVHWYKEGSVADDLDGRFEMIAAMLSLVLIRLEEEGEHDEKGVYLTEIFVDDMDGQLREIGIGDMLVGKHIGKMMAALGGRLTAYRSAFNSEEEMRGAISRNIFAGEDASEDSLTYLSKALRLEKDGLAGISAKNLISGKSGW